LYGKPDAARQLGSGLSDLEIGLRGLPRSLTVRPGTIVLQELMGMPDVKTQWRG